MDNSLLVLLLITASGVFAMLALGMGLKSTHGRYRAKFIERFSSVLPKFFVFVRAENLFAANSIFVFTVTALAYLMSDRWVIAGFVAVLAGAAPSVMLAVMRAKRKSLLANQFPEFASLLAGALRAGSSFQLALHSISSDLSEPLKQEVGLLLREQRLGVNVEDSLSALAHRLEQEDYTLLSAAVKIARLSGGNLADTLEAIATSSRRKLALEGKIRSLTAQGKLQGWVMAALPLFLALALFQIEPRAMQPLISTWYGAVVVLVVVGLQLAGLWFIRRIVAIDI